MLVIAQRSRVTKAGEPTFKKSSHLVKKQRPVVSVLLSTARPIPVYRGMHWVELWYVRKKDYAFSKLWSLIQQQ